MKKFNLEFIGDIVSSPRGRGSWAGSTVTFWGKFNEDDNKRYRRENLIEAISSEKQPSRQHFRCSAFQIIPEKYLFDNNQND